MIPNLDHPMSNPIEMLATFLEAAPVAAILVDEQGHILSINDKVTTLFGYHRQALVGQSIEYLMPDRFRAQHVHHRQTFATTPHVRLMGSGLDLIGQRKDGTEFPIEVGLSYFELEGKTIIQALITNITLRKQTQTLLEQRVQERTHEIEQRQRLSAGLRDLLVFLNSSSNLEELLNYIVYQANQQIDSDGTLIYNFDPLTEELVTQASYGVPKRYLASTYALIYEAFLAQADSYQRPMAVPNLLMADHQADTTHEAGKRALIEAGYQACLLIPLTTKHVAYGGLVWYHREPCHFSSEAINLALTFGDQASLAIENVNLKTDVEKSAVAAERSRLARDLHDSVTQSLFSASVIAEVLPRIWKRDQDEAENRLGELRQLTRGALAEMRTLLLELRPTALTEVPLPDLLKQLIAATMGRAHIPIELEIEGHYTLFAQVQVAFYRIAQEALNNVAKHSQATRAKVLLICEGKGMHLSINDDGQGFFMDDVQPNSLGLSIMRERAEGIQALLQIDSQPQVGTTVQVHWKG